MQMKKIKIIAIIVCILLLGLIFFTSRNEVETQDENNKKIELNKENVEQVINNGGRVLKYNGYIYYVDSTDSTEKGFNNKLCRINIKDNTKDILIDAERYSIGDRLIIFNNNIFFNMVGQTYYINLDNPNHYSEYNKGVLYYIGDGKLIYSHNNKIFKGTYYLKTLAINSISEIATLNSNYMFEDKDNLYFYSNNTDNSKSIISVNKENQTTKILDRIYVEENKKIEIIDFKQSQNYIYIILKNEMYQVRKISKDGSDINFVEGQDEILALYTLNDNFYFKIPNNLVLYEYKHKENKIVQTEKNNKAPDIYSTKLVENKIVLYKNDEEIASLLSDVKEYSNIYIEEIEDYLYIRLDIIVNGQRRILVLRLKNDGSNLEILNNI